MARVSFAVGVTLLLAASCTHAAPTTPVPRARPVAAALTSFGDCGTLTSSLRKEALKEVTAYGLPQPVWGLEDRGFLLSSSARATATDAVVKAALPTAHSTTNVQESGVDEPDTVKTDGSVMVISSNGHLKVVDVSQQQPVAVGDLLLHLDQPQLLLDGTTVIALGQVSRAGRLVTVVEVVDVADPAKPTAVRRFRLDGSLLDARVLHGRVVVAVSSAPRLRFTHPTSGAPKAQAAALKANRAVVQRAGVADLLPAVTVTPGGGTYRAACTATLRPGVASGLQRTSVITLDPAQDAPTQHVTVVGNAATVYASQDALYLATQPGYSGRGGVAFGVTGSTALHGFDVTHPDQIHYLGTGSVPGRLLDQYALSEQGGYLRVATTTYDGGIDNRITVLRPQQGVLVEVAHVGGLGIGERLFGVRFLGDTAYVVTFRQVDPLHVVDLSDPTRPTLRGQLTVSGYSSALYPLGNHQLLGLGQDAGTAASVFDTSDSGHPRLLGKAVLKSGWSSAEQDHHALLWWPRTRTVAFPFGAGTVVLKVSPSGDIGEQGRVTVKGGPVQRIVVVGDLLYSVSQGGLTTAPLERLDETTWLQFR
jgi:uncharacterized secreted protein with C-terminal beta-propeller domain